MIELPMDTASKTDWPHLYDQLSRRLYAYALSVSGDSSVSEDAVQEAFLRLFEYATFRDVKSLEGFLFAATRNVILDDRRRQAVRRDAILPFPLARPSGETDEQASQALGKLPLEQREAVVLKIYGDLTFAQIGQVTGVSGATAASRYRLALEKLAEVLSRSNS